MRRALSAAALVLATCAPAAPECFDYHPGLTVLPTFEVGAPYSGWVGLPMPFECLRSPITVRGTVLDAQNSVVPSIWVMSHEKGDARTRFDFTPESEGPFHFTAQFNPNLGTLQGDLYPSFPLQLRKLTELPLPTDAPCAEVVFSDGTLVATGPAGRSAHVYADGGVTQIIATSDYPDRFFRGGNALWLTTRGELQRLTPSNGTFSVTHRLPGANQVLAATELFAIALQKDAGVLFRYDINDAGSMDGIPLQGTPTGVYQATMTRDGGAFWSAGNDVCLTSLTVSSQRCLNLGPILAYLELDGVWVNARMATAFIGEDGVRRDTAMPSLYSGAPVATQEGLEMLYVRPTSTGFRFEKFPRGFVNASIDGDRLMMCQPGKVTIYER